MSELGKQEPAGWYPDVADPKLQRYWDGANWTAQTKPAKSGLLGALLGAGARDPWTESLADKQSKIVCSHCQQAGGVTAHQAKRRRRLSVTRVVGGVATMGASLPIVGTSKKNVVTEMNCSNCGMKWDVV